jgi:DNA-binding response OmpR family regulator
VLEWGELHLNPSNYEVTYGDKLLHLTPKEYQLLELFLRKHQLVLSRSLILDHLWSFEEPPGEEVVKVHLRALRKKLTIAGAAPDFIETVYGLGYRLKPL